MLMSAEHIVECAGLINLIWLKIYAFPRLQTMPPLLRRKPFVPKPLPENLKPDGDYFVCKATGEVFESYE